MDETNPSLISVLLTISLQNSLPPGVGCAAENLTKRRARAQEAYGPRNYPRLRAERWRSDYALSACPD